MWKYVCLVLLLAACVVVDARRKKNKGNRPGRGGPPEDVTAYTWNRALSEDPEPRVPQTVTEYGYSRDGQAVFVSSSKRGLRQNGFKVSNTTFDFTDGVMVEVMKVKKKCFLVSVSADQTLNTVLDKLQRYNGTTRSDDTQPMDMVTAELNDTVIQILNGRPDLTGQPTSFCGTKPIRGLAAGTASEGTRGKVLKVSALDKLLSIKLMREAGGNRGGRGGRRGGAGRGGRRGGGRGGRGGGRRGGGRQGGGRARGQ